MSDTSVPGPLVLMLRDIVAAWANRNERGAAQDAARLTFWRDGMMQQIEAIASGDHSRKIVEQLRKSFDESKEGVEQALGRLRQVRSKIGPNAIGNQVDLILNHAEYGKTGIRADIELLLGQLESLPGSQHPEIATETAKADARYLVESIHAFNVEIGKLLRFIQ